YEHTQRYAQRYEERIGQPHKEHQNNQNQNKPDYNRVYQIVKRGACGNTLITCDHNIQIFGEDFLFHLFSELLNGIAGFDKVFTTTFYNVERYNVFPVKTRVAFCFFDSILDGGNIFQIYRLPIGITQNDLFNIKG